MPRYKTKVFEFDAIHLYDDSDEAIRDVLAFRNDTNSVLLKENKSLFDEYCEAIRFDGGMWITNVSGGLSRVGIGDWLIRRPEDGVMWSCTDELFKQLYERVYNTNRNIPY